MNRLPQFSPLLVNRTPITESADARSTAHHGLAWAFECTQLLSIFIAIGSLLPSWVSHRVRMMTRWPGDSGVSDPNDPLTRWPNDPVPCLLETVGLGPRDLSLLPSTARDDGEATRLWCQTRTNVHIFNTTVETTTETGLWIEAEAVNIPAYRPCSNVSSRNRDQGLDLQSISRFIMRLS